MQTHSLKDPVMRKPTEHIVGGGIINFKIRGFFPFFSSFPAAGSQWGENHSFAKLPFILLSIVGGQIESSTGVLLVAGAGTGGSPQTSPNPPSHDCFLYQSSLISICSMKPSLADAASLYTV